MTYKVISGVLNFSKPYISEHIAFIRYVYMRIEKRVICNVNCCVVIDGVLKGSGSHVGLHVEVLIHVHFGNGRNGRRCYYTH